ncbi:MAG: OmpA family protein [Methyloprofundus sp.]|nr:OmpA family protein [Methyloprofundus sp.]
MVIPVLLASFVWVSVYYASPVEVSLSIFDDTYTDEVVTGPTDTGSYIVAPSRVFKEPTPKRFGLSEHAVKNSQESTPDKDKPQQAFISGDAYKVYFDLGSSVIPDEQKGSLLQMISCAKGRGFFEFEVQGYASPDGAYEINEDLSKSRAFSVKDFIHENFDGLNVFIKNHEAKGGFFKEKIATIIVK